LTSYRKDGFAVRKLISLGILAAFLAAVSAPSIGCSKASTKKGTTAGKPADEDPTATPNPKKK
jgi:hypothetical protein